jgi:glutathione S-transferase
MKLYYAPGACSLASHILIEELGLAFTYEKVDLKAHKTERGEDYTRINPKGYVPALELEDGTLLTENVALLPYLALQKPEAGLAPQDEMGWARLMEWLGYITSELHKSFGPIFHKKNEDAANEARSNIEKRLRFVDNELEGKTFLLGGRFSVADAYLFVMLTWCPKASIDLAKFPALVLYREKLGNRPSIKAAMKAEGLI